MPIFPDPKVEVSFEVQVDREHADFKGTETKIGLGEVGLDEGVGLI